MPSRCDCPGPLCFMVILPGCPRFREPSGIRRPSQPLYIIPICSRRTNRSICSAPASDRTATSRPARSRFKRILSRRWKGWTFVSRPRRSHSASGVSTATGAWRSCRALSAAPLTEPFSGNAHAGMAQALGEVSGSNPGGSGSAEWAGIAEAVSTRSFQRQMGTSTLRISDLSDPRRDISIVILAGRPEAPTGLEFPSPADFSEPDARSTNSCKAASWSPGTRKREA